VPIESPHNKNRKREYPLANHQLKLLVVVTRDEDAIQLEWLHHSHQDFISHLREAGKLIGDSIFEGYHCEL